MRDIVKNVGLLLSESDVIWNATMFPHTTHVK
jgi:hypothetical protein